MFVVNRLTAFMECALQTWCNLHFTTDKGHIGLMPIAYNSALCKKSKLHLFTEKPLKHFWDKGIVTVKDFIDSFDDLKKEERRVMGANYIMEKVSNAWVTQADSGIMGEVSPFELLLGDIPTVRSIY